MCATFFILSFESSSHLIQANRDKQTLVPATVKMLNDGIYDGDADILRVDNIDLYSVKLIGLVESVEGHSTSTIYKINDGTGTFELKKWIDGQQTAEDKDGTFRYNCIEVLSRKQYYPLFRVNFLKRKSNDSCHWTCQKLRRPHAHASSSYFCCR